MRIIVAGWSNWLRVIRHLPDMLIIALVRTMLMLT